MTQPQARVFFLCEWERRGDRAYVLTHRTVDPSKQWYATVKEAKQNEAARMRAFADELLTQAAYLEGAIRGRGWTGD